MKRGRGKILNNSIARSMPGLLLVYKSIARSMPSLSLVYELMAKSISNKLMVHKLEKVRPEAKIPAQTYKIRPLRIVPFIDVKETEIGIAQMDSENIPYAKLRGKIDIDRVIVGPAILPLEEDIVTFDKQTRRGD
jgi:hypothetical protein